MTCTLNNLNNKKEFILLDKTLFFNHYQNVD